MQGVSLPYPTKRDDKGLLGKGIGMAGLGRLRTGRFGPGYKRADIQVVANTMFTPASGMSGLGARFQLSERSYDTQFKRGIASPKCAVVPAVILALPKGLSALTGLA